MTTIAKKGNTKRLEAYMQLDGDAAKAALQCITLLFVSFQLFYPNLF
jgi:hypothetical protein